MHLLWNVTGWYNKNNWTLKLVKIWIQDEEHTRKWSHMIHYFICFPIFLLFHMAWKLLGLTKYTFQQVSLPYQKLMSVQYGEILLGISYCTLGLTLQCDLQLFLIICLPIHAITWWFRFFCSFTLTSKISSEGEEKGKDSN